MFQSFYVSRYWRGACTSFRKEFFLLKLKIETNGPHPPGVRRERCSYRGARHRRGGLQPRDPTGRGLVRVGLGSRAQRHLHLEAPLAPLPQAKRVHHSAMSPEEFISRIMEAEPPEIYLMEDMNKPFTESSMMMSLTNLADKELVLMISWAKKIPGEIIYCSHHWLFVNCRKIIWLQLLKFQSFLCLWLNWI